MPDRRTSMMIRGPNHYPRTSRNPGRHDGFLWNGNTFICPSTVDGFRRDLRHTAAAHDDADGDGADAEDPIVGPDPRVRERHEVALEDIARQAKAKGSVKKNSGGFEMVDAPRRVIVLDEDVFSVSVQPWTTDDEEWEDINAFDLDMGMGEGSSGATVGRDSESEDYLLARRLQDEEDALYARRLGLSDSGGGRRRAYADVVAHASAAMG
ncbi:hypothetical protein C8R46DRAFT_556470 [Mycena filopes]|nr:hypothetical protein C8R46DRAFT_556470 [Mycena filopes]